jgi:hypothetical protein
LGNEAATALRPMLDNARAMQTFLRVILHTLPTRVHCGRAFAIARNTCMAQQLSA